MRVPTLLLALTVPSAALAGPVQLGDLAGHWAAERWAAALEETLSPLAAAQVEAPLAFALQSEGGGSFRLAVTTFHEGTWRPVLGLRQAAHGAVLVVGGLEDESRSSRDRVDIALSYERDAGGRIAFVTAALWPGEMRTVRFRRLDEPVEAWSRRVVIDGRYVAGLSSERWVFSAQGSAERPGHSPARLEVNLDPSEACCDWLTIGDERLGFAWHEGALHLYSMVKDPEDCPLSCAGEPFVTLLPERTRPWRGRQARAALTAPQRLVPAEVRPLPGSNDRWYAAREASVEVRLANPSGHANPDGFNDPPFLIQAGAEARSCSADATNARRDGVWISADGRLVAFATWSGSSRGFEVFDASSCRRTAQVDASGGLAVAGALITVDPGCEPDRGNRAGCWPGAIYRLDADGTLSPLVAEGRERTRAMLGVAIDRPADVESPYSARARVVAGAGRTQ